jgi:signal transduction histidine kinase
VTSLAEVDTINHDCKLILKFTPALPQLNCDEIQIQQVILNLIRNAMEAMEDLPEDSDKIVSIETKLQGTDFIAVSIEDCGRGFEPKDEKVLFDAFYTTKSSGMGMGLTICNTIINAHGGTINCIRKESKGAMFTFSLPVENLDSELEVGH